MPRPQLKPTEEQRRMVKAMAAMGIRQEDIASMFKIKSPKTLRKFYREELDRGLTEATFNMEQAQYKAGMAGNSIAQINWLSRHKRCLDPVVKAAPSLPPFIVSKEVKDKP